MPTLSTRPLLRLATIGTLVAALGLSACGRKGELDPPPGAAVVAPQEPAPRAGLGSPIAVNPLGAGTPSSPAASSDDMIGPDGQRLPRGPKRPIPLDVLLN